MSSEFLQRARDLIAKGWTQGAYARTLNGQRTTVQDPQAASFCIAGALMRAVGNPNSYHLGRKHLAAVVGERIVDWNDKPGRTQEEVLAAFDKAIELSKEEK